MNNKALTILISITLALVCVLLIINLAVDAPATKIDDVSFVSHQKDVVSVYGQGKISVKPDVVYLTCGYENIDMDPKAAQSENAENMQKIIDEVIAAGIEEENIQTAKYSVNQEYDYNGGQKKILGYRVTNLINIKISEVDKASEIINIAIGAGGNVFSGINFDIVEKQQAYLDAMDIALERAEEKAQAFAKKEGREISGVLEISEGTTSSNTTRSILYNSVSIDGYMLSGQAVSSGSAISTGQVEIVATVTVVYSMR